MKKHNYLVCILMIVDISVKDPPGTDPALVDSITSEMASAPPESPFMYLRQITHDLEQSNTPIVVINFDNRALGMDAMDRYGILAYIVPGTGHFLMPEAPVKLNEIRRKAIKRMES